MKSIIFSIFLVLLLTPFNITADNEHKSVSEIDYLENDDTAKSAKNISDKLDKLVDVIDDTEDEKKLDVDFIIAELNKIRDEIKYLRWKTKEGKVKEKINALSYIVVDIDDEKILMERGSQNDYPIASITKLMSSLVVKEDNNIDEEVVLNPEMLSTIYNKTPALFPYLTISIDKLIRASLIGSINDAAQSFNYLTEDDLIETMNKKARSVGMNSTTFVDAHGIGSGNRASSTDVAKLLYYIYIKHPDIFEITRDEDFWLPDIKNTPIKFTNRNLFHGVSEFVGGKTGFTNASQQTFAGMFEFDEKPYIVVLLYSRNRTNDTKVITDWLREKPII